MYGTVCDSEDDIKIIMWNTFFYLNFYGSLQTMQYFQDFPPNICIVCLIVQFSSETGFIKVSIKLFLYLK